MVQESWSNVGSLNWWVAPSEKQSENAMNEIIQMLPPGSYDKQVGNGRLILKFPDGSERSRIEFKTGSDPAKLRGFAVNFYVMDEAAQGMPEGSFTSVETTTTNTKGRGIIISTPNGRGWFYDVYDRGRKYWDDGSPRYSEGNEDPYPDYMSIRLPTYANPYNDKKAILRKKQSMSAATFRQEYLAEFLLESAGVFDNISGFFKPELALLESPEQGHDYVMGVDLADRDDYTVLTVMDRRERKVVAWKRFNKIGWVLQKQRISEMQKKWNAICVIDDTGVGNAINADLRAMGVPIHAYVIGTNKAKCFLIESLVVAMENGYISSPVIGELRNELEYYEVKTTASGAKLYSAPRGRHDDCVVSLALANLLCTRAVTKYSFRNLRGV